MIHSIYSRIILGSFLALVAFSACNPLDKNYNRYTVEADYKKIIEVNEKEIDSTQAAMFAEYLVKHGLMEKVKPSSHHTYRDFFNDAMRQKEKMDREALENAQLMKANDPQARLDAIKKTLGVTISDTVAGSKPKPKPGNKMTWELTFVNLGQKNLKAFRGYIKFSDILGNEVAMVPVNVYKPLNAGDTLSVSYSDDFTKAPLNSYNVGTEVRKLKAAWLSETIVFEEGTSISTK